MKITVDTNVLVRAVVRDDEEQGRAADEILTRAEIVAVPLPCLCEFVWVLRRVYNFGRHDISAALKALFNAGNVVVNRQAADAGLAMFNAGGDFADGVIAHEGSRLGGEAFVSFDKKAIALVAQRGYRTIVPSSSPVSD